jgi:hypothetical protein
MRFVRRQRMPLATAFKFRTTVVDKFRELGNVYGNDGSERELDDVCAKKINGGAMLKTKSGETVTSRPIASVRQG